MSIRNQSFDSGIGELRLNSAAAVRCRDSFSQFPLVGSPPAFGAAAPVEGVVPHLSVALLKMPPRSAHDLFQRRPSQNAVP